MGYDYWGQKVDEAISELEKAELAIVEARRKLSEAINHYARAMDYVLTDYDKKQMVSNLKHFAEAISDILSRLEYSTGETRTTLYAEKYEHGR